MNNNKIALTESKENVTILTNNFKLNQEEAKEILDYLYSFSNIVYDFLNDNKYNFIENDEEKK